MGELVSVGQDHALYVWDMNTRALVRTLIGHSDHITFIARLSNQRVIATCSIDMTLCLWDLETYSRKGRIRTGSCVKHASYAQERLLITGD